MNRSKYAYMILWVKYAFKKFLRFSNPNSAAKSAEHNRSTLQLTALL